MEGSCDIVNVFKMKALHLGSNEKNSVKNLNKSEVRLAEGKYKMNSLKIKLQKC